MEWRQTISLSTRKHWLIIFSQYRLMESWDQCRLLRYDNTCKCRRNQGARDVTVKRSFQKRKMHQNLQDPAAAESPLKPKVSVLNVTTHSGHYSSCAEMTSPTPDLPDGDLTYNNVNKINGLDSKLKWWKNFKHAARRTFPQEWQLIYSITQTTDISMNMFVNVLQFSFFPFSLPLTLSALFLSKATWISFTLKWVFTKAIFSKHSQGRSPRGHFVTLKPLFSIFQRMHGSLSNTAQMIYKAMIFLKKFYTKKEDHKIKCFCTKCTCNCFIKKKKYKYK